MEVKKLGKNGIKVETVLLYDKDCEKERVKLEVMEDLILS